MGAGEGGTGKLPTTKENRESSSQQKGKMAKPGQHDLRSNSIRQPDRTHERTNGTKRCPGLSIPQPPMFRWPASGLGSRVAYIMMWMHHAHHGLAHVWLKVSGKNCRPRPDSGADPGRSVRIGVCDRPRCDCPHGICGYDEVDGSQLFSSTDSGRS